MSLHYPKNNIQLSAPENSHSLYFLKSLGVILVDFAPPGRTARMSTIAARALSSARLPAAIGRRLLKKSGVILRHDYTPPGMFLATGRLKMQDRKMQDPKRR